MSRIGEFTLTFEEGAAVHLIAVHILLIIGIMIRVQDPENSLVWHQQVLGWLNRYSGVGAGDAHAVSLDDTTVPVVNYNP